MDRIDRIEIPKMERIVKASVAAPPSKSVTNRALALAALALGPSSIRRALYSEDTSAMTGALVELGASVTDRGGGTWEVEGTGGRLRAPEAPLDVLASGTALRFLTAIASLAPGPVTITGVPRLCERPMADLIVALRRLHVLARAEGRRGRPPVWIPGGGFPGGPVTVSGRLSSQFVSALLIVGPYGRSDLELTLRGRVTSEPYIALTLDLMRRFGGEVDTLEPRRAYRVRAHRGYEGRDYLVEGDASSASYFFALAAMSGQRLSVENLAAGSRQGDLGFLSLLQAMGCEVERTGDRATVQGGRLVGIEADMGDMPDLVPTLAMTALWADGRTSIRNAQNLRLKESDRLAALAAELRKVGARVRELADGLLIETGRARESSPVTVATYGDHRIAMSFATLGLLRGGIAIEDPGCVAKSYPSFWQDMAAVTGFPL